MADFFVDQLDFILFFYGLAFILLGSVCVAVARGSGSVIDWRVLGTFGYLHGISEWLDLSALIFGDTPTFALVRTAVMAVSFMALFEFGRRELARLYANTPDWWVQVPLIAVPVLGWYLAGTGGANVCARYTFALTGALLTSFVLFANAAAASPSERRWLNCAALAFVFYGIAAGGIVPNVAHFSGDFFNYDDFVHLTHMPIQFVRGLLACFVAFSVWAYWGQRIVIDVASARYSNFQRRQFFWTLAAMGTILVGGWFLTDYLGRIYKQNVQQASASDINLIASKLNGETAAIDSMVKALGASRSVNALAAGDRGALAKRGGTVLRLDTDAAGALASYILDASGAMVSSAGAAKPQNFRGASYFKDALAGGAGSHFASGNPSEPARYYASYPIRDAGGPIVGVAVLEKSLETFTADLEHLDRSFALTDANGVVLLTNRPAMQFRALWPLKPEQMAELRKKYTTLNEKPVLDAEIVEAAWVRFDDTRDYVERRALTHGDWSLITWKAPQGVFASRVLGIIITLQMAVLALVYLIGRERWIYDHIQLEKRLELEELARNLDFRATTDPLTGLFNRRKFDRVLATEFLRAQRYKTPLSLLLYDVDHFKQVNDTHGHQAGDKVLTALSRFVETRIRNSDVLARWGGEEFAILCPGSNGAMACQLAGNLRDSIAQNTIEGAGMITCSFGVAQFEDSDSPETLLARADDALYRAKLNGRNTVELAPQPVIASPPLQQVE